jgi:hypothetical protein
MAERTVVRSLLTILPLLALAEPAAAADPVFDPMRPSTGPTATAPRPAEREMRRDFGTKTPTLTERFGLPPVSGPLPVPRRPERPVLVDPSPGTLPPPRPDRARYPRDRDGCARRPARTKREGPFGQRRRRGMVAPSAAGRAKYRLRRHDLSDT